MAHVKCRYVVDDFDVVERLFLEGDYKKVIWDGLELKVGKKTILTHAWYEYKYAIGEECTMGGSTDIEYLAIDGHVYIEEDEQ